MQAKWKKMTTKAITKIEKMEKKYFPIKSESACQLKWNWSTIRLYIGTTSSCHRVDSDLIEFENDFNFHNTSKKLADRTLMLSGQWPKGGCEYCYNIEQVGGSSDRMFHSKLPDQYPQELDVDPTAIRVSPKIVEIYLDNVCNLSCLYCWDGFSSKIQQENNKHGDFNSKGVIIKNYAKKHPQYDELKIKFWEWLSANSSTLTRINLLGGEPFYQKEFEVCLQFLENSSNPNLEFSVTSNLMIDPDKFKLFIERIKRLVIARKVKRFDVIASVDCFGPEQEYVRYGLDLSVWKTNFEYLVEQKWITLAINQTISTLTIKTMLPLIDYINEKRKARKLQHYFSTVVRTHDFLHPQIFGKDFYKQDFESIIAAMPEETWDHVEAKKYMQGIWLQINSKERDQEAINRLGVYLDEIDRRRNLNWRGIFPWLEQEINNVVQ